MAGANVLAVLDDVIAGAEGANATHVAAKRREARAAVAELIEASQHVALWMPNSLVRDRLRAAIENVGAA